MDPKIEADKRGSSVGELRKRQELMEDGRRYIIYFTFAENDSDADGEPAEEEDV